MLIGYIANMILNLFVFLLLIAVYSYIIKLEQISCACAEHPNKNFIKGFSLFALVFLGIVTFVPMGTIINTFGTTVAGLFAFVKFIFYIICIVYFYMILDYTRYLVNEKCKCSEDYRRSLIMAGSVIEIIILFLILLIIIILPIVFNSVSIIVRNMDGFEKEVSSAVRNPYESVKKIPKNLKSVGKMVTSIGKESKKGLTKMLKPNAYGRI
jgi:predicted PurR-regulated permease PerM